MEKQAPAKTLRPFGMRDKVGYALGDFGCNLSFALITTYLADFYTQYIGLTEATWAIIILFLKIWDAINDPLMGGIMDARRIGTRSKFKPWIRIGSFGLIVSGALAFTPIPNAAYATKVIVCVVTYLAWDVFYTLVNVPYGTLNSAITADANERTQLSIYRSIGAGVGGLITMLLPLFIYDKNDNLLGERFIWAGLLMGGVAFLAYHYCLKLTTERVAVQAQAEKYNYLKTMKRVFSNKPLMAMCIASFALIVFYSSDGQTTKWVFQTYFHNTQLLTLASLIGSVFSVIMMPFAGRLVRRFGKKKAVTAPLLVSLVLGSVFLFVPMPREGSSGMVLYMLALVILKFGASIFQLVCWAMIADCTDYQQLQTGVREEGSVYAFYSLFRKLAQGVSASLIITLMTRVGYEAKRGPNQLAGVAESMKSMSIGLMLVGILIMVVAMLLLYTIDKEQEQSMKEQLGLAQADVDVNAALQNSNE